MARGKPNSKKVVERPKTRKELRKDKRLQKKANRVHFHKRKKELKIEYRERLKQQKKNAAKGPKRNRAADDDDDDAGDDEEAIGDDDIYDQADMSSGDEDDDPNVRGTDDSDEEIESDFELSDEELEQKFAGRVKATTKATPKQAQKAKKAQPSEHDRFTADLQKEKQKQRKLEKEMRKQRVKQLRAANEDEDKMIRKLEKQLKIDKKRSEKHVPTMFNDGLEYALELCLPENIQKMYTAAKEAAENEEDSDSGFQEDLAMAMGETGGKSKKRKRDEAEEKQPEKSATKRKARDVAAEAATVRSAHKMAKLRQVESKYFDTDDELDSDLSGNDSEFEHEGEESDDQVLEVHNQHKKKKQQKASKDAEAEFSDGSDFGLQDDENDFEDDESDSGDEEGDEEYSDEEESDDEGPEEVHKAMKSKPAAAKKAGGNKRTVEADSEDSEEDDEDDDFDDDSEPEVEEPRPGKTKAKQEKSVKKTADPDSDDFGDGDDIDEDDFDEDVFGLSSGDEADESPAAGKKNQPKSDVWEDIYGRTRDKDGNVITTKPTGDAPAAGAPTKYLPPHLRARAEAAAAAGNADATTATNPLDDDPKRREKLLRLRKQLKGYINRLSEANMHRIATDIETVYMQNSRHDVNDTLTQLIEAALVSNVLAPERMVLEHMMLIAALHANVGSEVGAHFLQRFVERLDSQLSAIDTYDVEDKRLDNVLFVLCHMYTFKLFQHNLIYEILNRLTATLSEKSVECILLALRSIGFALRKDDAIALKDLIAVLQRKAGEASKEFKNNPRLRYMLDVVLAIKNNNVNKIPSYDPALAEHLRKILRTMLVNGRYVTTLNITLDDLLRADSRGKWWVVGSAWTGNVTDIGGAQQQQQQSAKQTAAFAEATQFSATILALAKKQRMNTDDRRNVFCILMTAEDYLDAFEKLHHLGIRDQKVIVTVLIHCCLSEKVYNPYYAVLAQKFCDFDRKYQLAVQFALWDRIRELATSASPLQVKNMAQFMGHLIEHGGLALSVLKVVEFGELDKVTLRLVRQVVLGLLMGTEAVCKQVFERIAPSGKLKAFKDSLRLFLHHFLMKGGAKSGVPEAKMDLLRARIRLADKALETADSKLQF